MRERNEKIIITILSAAVIEKIISRLVILLPNKNNNANGNRLIKVTTNGFLEEQYWSVPQLFKNYYAAQLHSLDAASNMNAFYEMKLK